MEENGKAHHLLRRLGHHHLLSNYQRTQGVKDIMYLGHVLEIKFRKSGMVLPRTISQDFIKVNLVRKRLRGCHSSDSVSGSADQGSCVFFGIRIDSVK